MGKRYPPLKRREVVANLKALGFVYAYSSGGHDYYQRTVLSGDKAVTSKVTVDQGIDEFSREGGILDYMVEQAGLANLDELYRATRKTARKLGG